jgi:prolyl oligopeptidase
MRTGSFAIPLLALVPMTAAPPAAAQDTVCTLPATPTVDVIDDYHGVTVRDPYRWLEDADAHETRAWIAQQNCVTFRYLNAIPERAELGRRLTALWDYPKYGTPFREGDHYFYFKNDGLQNQSVLYVQDSLDGEAAVLLDPNGLSEDGTVALTTLAFTHDGSLLAYGTAVGGSDWREFRVRDVATRRDFPDHLRWIKFSGASWTHDGKGFFYSRYPRPQGDDTLQVANRHQRLYYHALGTSQDGDRLIYERPDQPEWGFSGSVTEDGRYLIVSVWHGTDERNRVYYKDLERPASPLLAGPVVRLLDDFDASYDFVGNDGDVFYFRTNLDAPRYRLIAINVHQPSRERWREIIPESDEVLDGVRIVHGTFVADYLEDAHTRIALFDGEGRHMRDLPLPTLGSVGGMSGRPQDDELFYTFTSFLYPPTIFRYDFATSETSVFKAPAVDFDPARYETRQVFYSSRDGTRIPIFITHRTDLERDGSNPTYLYGYGGFNVSITPSFSVSALVWLERGGVYAVANLRGGGEYGEEWHRAGMLENKQNVFDDFIAAAEFLIEQGYTRPAKLAIGGASNGGLLVGAVLNQRPDLFGAALPAVGVMDMLRFHRFTIGWAWVSDYGSPDDPEQFRFLRAYSPLHNLVPGTRYPAVLVTTADHDDRVVPGHSFKYAAALQAAQAGDAPVLIRVETRAGHGAGKPTAKIIEEQADRWAFLIENLDAR